MKLYTFTKENGEIIEQVRAENHSEALAKVQDKTIDRTTDFFSEEIEEANEEKTAGMKAKLVYFSLTTRVIVPADANDEYVAKKAVEKLMSDHGQLVHDKLIDGLEDVEDDTECPYGTFAHDRIVGGEFDDEIAKTMGVDYPSAEERMLFENFIDGLKTHWNIDWVDNRKNADLHPNLRKLEVTYRSEFGDIICYDATNKKGTMTLTDTSGTLGESVEFGKITHKMFSDIDKIDR